MKTKNLSRNIVIGFVILIMVITNLPFAAHCDEPGATNLVIATFYNSNPRIGSKIENQEWYIVVFGNIFQIKDNH